MNFDRIANAQLLRNKLENLKKDFERANAIADNNTSRNMQNEELLRVNDKLALQLEQRVNLIAKSHYEHIAFCEPIYTGGEARI